MRGAIPRDCNKDWNHWAPITFGNTIITEHLSLAIGTCNEAIANAQQHVSRKPRGNSEGSSEYQQPDNRARLNRG